MDELNAEVSVFTHLPLEVALFAIHSHSNHSKAKPPKTLVLADQKGIHDV